MLALHISVFKKWIQWQCIAIAAKFPNRSTALLLTSQLWLCLTQEKDHSASTFPTRIRSNLLASFRVFRKTVVSTSCFETVAISSESFCCRMQSDFHLLSSPKTYERHNVIPCLCQALVDPVYFILIMLTINFRDEPTMLKF